MVNNILNLARIPNEEDKIVINQAKRRGYKWLATDEDKRTFGYCLRPTKRRSLGKWLATGRYGKVSSISFLSWEDEEPYYIGE